MGDKSKDRKRSNERKETSRKNEERGSTRRSRSRSNPKGGEANASRNSRRGGDSKPIQTVEFFEEKSHDPKQGERIDESDLISSLKEDVNFLTLEYNKRQ